MNPNISRHASHGGYWSAVCSAKVGVVGLFILAGLLLGACHDGAPAVIGTAAAAPDASPFYFPAQFPLPEGPPEPYYEMH